MEEVPRSITVRGIGSVAAAPNIVRLNLGVQSFNKDLTLAIADNNDRIDRLITVIEGYGIPETDYRTSNFSVFYQQPYSPEKAPEDGTYNVNNNIFIELEELENIGEFIQNALQAGANQFYGLEYTVSEPEQYVSEARRLAIDNALELAEETAGFAGLATGEIISIEEQQSYNGGPMYAMEMSAGRGANSIVTPSEKLIQVFITLEIELK